MTVVPMPHPRCVRPTVMDVRAGQLQRTCQVCGTGFTARRRDAQYCSPPCTQRAYRWRHQRPLLAPELVRRPSKQTKVYECPECETRFVGEQRCPDCGIFCRLLGPGGECPHCGEAVALSDLGLEIPGS